jgi:ketosteroid isomerase-like protein
VALRGQGVIRAELEAGASLRDTAAEMSHAAVDIVRGMYEAFQAGDAERALAHFDQEVLVDATARVDTGVGRGRQAVSAIVGSWVAAFEDWSEEIEEVQDLGDQVCVVATQRGRGKETGLRVENRYAVLYEVRGDKITRMRMYPEPETALEAAAASNQGDPNAPR